MIHNPVDEGVFKADVAPRFFRFQPLVPKDFFALRLKFLIQRKIFQASVHFLNAAFFGMTLRFRVQNQFYSTLRKQKWQANLLFLSRKTKINLPKDRKSINVFPL